MGFAGLVLELSNANKSYDNSVKLKRTEVELELSLNGPQPELDKRIFS